MMRSGRTGKPPLLIGFLDEKTFGHFVGYLEGRGDRFEVLDFAQFADLTQFQVTAGDGSLDIELNGRSYCLQDYDAFYCRYYYRATGDPLADEAQSIAIEHLSTFLEATHRCVANPPSAGMENGSKLLQLMDLQRFGFAVPESWLIGSRAEALRLTAGDKQWITKGCSGTRTRVELLAASDHAGWSLLGNAPVQFQEWIDGADVRIHVVGQEVVALKIVSPICDYRYAPAEGKELDCLEIEPPQTIKRLCRHYALARRLAFCGFDFKIASRDGLWYVLEANPMPGYDFFDKRVDHRISRALRRLLYAAEGGARPAADSPDLFLDLTRRPKVAF